MPQNPYGTFDPANNPNLGTSREMELIGIIGDNSTSFDKSMVAESVSEESFLSAESNSRQSFEIPADPADPKDVMGATGNSYSAAADSRNEQSSEMGIVLFGENHREESAHRVAERSDPFYDMDNMSISGKLIALNGLLRKALNQEDMLTTAVVETRQLLKTDRVVVFRLKEDLNGVVINESVAPGFPEALGRHIEDPCFKDWYAKHYREGKVTVINNVQEANFARCYIEALGLLEVKANIVAPLIKDDQLFGLLVAHQCSRPREWQQDDVSLFTQIAMQVGVALERVSFSEQRRAETKRTELQANIARLLYRDGLDWDDVLETAVIETKQALMTDRAVIFKVSEDYLSGTVVHESVAPSYPKALNRLIEDPCFKEWYVKHYKEGHVTVINDIYKTSFADCYIKALERLDVKANMVAAIVTDQKLYGLLVTHQCSRPREWQTAEIELFRQIAVQTGVALDRASFQNQRKNEAKKAEAQIGITKMLHQEALNLGNVLRTTVLETRQSLRADRVMILRFKEDFVSGTVTQESVAPGLPQALNREIEDPCFREWYLKHYKEGNVTTIDDIYKAKFANCYIKALERLGVRANMVAPIVRDEPLQGPQLYGLLIAHQCSAPREWQQSEVNLFTQVAIQTGFALERADLLESREAEIEKVFSRTDTSQLVQMIRTPSSPEELLKEATDEVRQLLKTDRSMFLRFNDDWSAIVTYESAAPGSPEAMYRRIEDPAFEEWYAQHYKEDKVYAINSTREAADYYIKALEQIGATAYLVAPIIKGERLHGLLIAQQLSGSQEWRQSAIDGFHQIAVRVNFVLEQREIQEQQEALLHEKEELLAQGQRASEALTVIGMSQGDMQRQREELQQQQDELMKQKQELMEQGEAARKALVAASLDQKTLREQREVLLKQRSALLKQRKDLLERLNRGEERTEKESHNNVLEKLKRLWPPR
jgi:methyl-accepting chemotaxis protein PixJ